MQYGHRVRKGRVRLLLVVAVIAGTIQAILPSEAVPVGAEAPKTERVSLANGGIQAKLGGAVPSISANGRFVAFQSSDPELVPQDKNGLADIFVFDRQVRTTERVSVSSGGSEGNGTSSFATISGDGRFVAFESESSNLVPGDTNGLRDIFVHDRQTGTTDRVNVSSAGNEANKADLLSGPSISADGRFVAFETSATNLIAGGTTAAYSVFVHDRQTRITELASVDSAGRPAGGSSYFPAISRDGRFVAFASDSATLVPGDTNGVDDIFVHDRQTGTTERISVGSGGNQGNAGSSYAIPSLSDDGHFVVFGSNATNLLGVRTESGGEIYVRDRWAGTTEIASTDTKGNQVIGAKIEPAISGDGRLVAFASGSTTLVPSDTNGAEDVFAHDRRTGETIRVSVDTSGVQGNGYSSTPSISADGTVIAFYSYATNLVSDDTNGAPDVFVRTNANIADNTTTSTSTTIPTNSLTYVALGDSFSAGDGARDPQSGWIVDGNNTDRSFNDECHRSNSAYPEKVALPSFVSRYFVACSGAIIADYDHANHSWSASEGAQKSLLSSKTDVVTLTMGGNDLGFADVVTYCAVAPSCQQELDSTARANIDALYPALVGLYKQILTDTAHHAAVWVLGYPKFLGTTSASCVTGLDPDEIVWLNQMLDRFNNVIHTATQEAGVHFVPTADALSGHEVCTRSGTPGQAEWANGLGVAAKPFHPNVYGQLELAHKLQSADGWPSAANPKPDSTVVAPPKPGPHLNLRPLSSLSGVDAKVATGLEVVGGLSKLVLQTTFYAVPNATYHVVLHSSVIDVGDLRSASDGKLIISIPIPDGLESGTHVLAITGLDPSGGTMEVLAPFELAPRTVTSFSSSPNPSTSGESLTLTAKVKAVVGTGTPTGRVAFESDGTSLGITALVGGSASLTTSSLQVGVHSLSATYLPDEGWSASQSVLSQTVNTRSVDPAPVRLIASPMALNLIPSFFGGPAFSARLTLGATGSALSGQAIVFLVAGREVCRATTTAIGQASCGKFGDLLKALISRNYLAQFVGSPDYAPVRATAGVF